MVLTSANLLHYKACSDDAGVLLLADFGASLALAQVWCIREGVSCI